MNRFGISLDGQHFDDVKLVHCGPCESHYVKMVFHTSDRDRNVLWMKYEHIPGHISGWKEIDTDTEEERYCDVRFTAAAKAEILHQITNIKDCNVRPIFPPMEVEL